MASPRPADYHDFYEEFEEEGVARSLTPNRLRAQVNKLLQDTNIKITEFQKIIGVNANSYGKFMHGKYKDQWSATQNGTYWAAAYFFYREKRLGSKSMAKLRGHGASSSAGTPAVATPAGAAPSAAGVGSKTPLPDVSPYSTDGITFQTPHEVRKDLRSALQKFDSSVAALARAADVPYQSFNNFMKATGEFGGRDNQAYHPAAQLVERLRLATGKEKSKKRKALEAEMDDGIVDRHTGGPKLGLDPNGKYLVPAGMPLFFTKDELGRNVMARF